MLASFLNAANVERDASLLKWTIIPLPGAVVAKMEIVLQLHISLKAFARA